VRTELKTTIGQLNVLEGASQEWTANMAVFEPTFFLSRRGKEKLYLLIELTGPQWGREGLCEKLLEIGKEAYFNAPGSITAGLRQAIEAINAHLLRENLNALSKERWSGGITCMVLRGHDLFIAQAGPALAYVAHGGGGSAAELHPYPPDWWQRRGTAPLGSERDVEIGFFHCQVGPGDVILVAESALARLATPDELSMALARRRMSEALDDLERLAGQGDLSAMIIKVAEKRVKAEERIISTCMRGIKWPRPDRSLIPAIAKLGRRLARGTLIALAYLLQEMKELLRRTLPGQRASPLTFQHSIAEEDQTLRRGIAVAIPILVALLVLGIYWQQGRRREARFEMLVQRAEVEKRAALSNPEDKAAVRKHLKEALSLIAQAAALKQLDEGAEHLRKEIQKELDELDRVNRLYWLGELWTYRPEGDPCRVLVDGRTVYVLDRGTAQLYKHHLDKAGMELQGPEQSEVILGKGQQVGEVPVGELMDMALVPSEEEQASGLLILGSDGLLLRYDPGEGLTVLSSGGKRYRPLRIDTYLGNLYLLDQQSNQIFRFRAGDDEYSQPEDYFPPSVQVDLGGVVDMAIDGNIYLLYADGRISKFYNGQPAPFAQAGLPEPLRDPTAIFTGPDTKYLYVADPGNGRIVEFSKEGRFIQQFKLQKGEAFSRVKDLFVEEVKKTLYFISGDKLLVAHISSEADGSIR